MQLVFHSLSSLFHNNCLIFIRNSIGKTHDPLIFILVNQLLFVIYVFILQDIIEAEETNKSESLIFFLIY